MISLHTISSCLLCLTLAAANSVKITEISVPKALPVGSNAELQCHYSLEREETLLFYVKWWFVDKDGAPKQIYQRIGKGAAQHLQSNVKVKGNDTIELEDLKFSDAGKYQCEVSNLDEDRKAADLIVYTPGTGPQLNYTVVESVDGSDKEIQVICEAEDVAPQPELTITINGESIHNSREDVELEEDSDLMSVVVNTTVKESELEDPVITCELTFINTTFKHPPYSANFTYSTGDELTSDAPQWQTTMAPLTDGCIVHHCSWFMMAASAALAHALKH